MNNFRFPYRRSEAVAAITLVCFFASTLTQSFAASGPGRNGFALVDLTQMSGSVLGQRIASLTSRDLVIVNEAMLGDRGTRSALKASEASFSIKSDAGSGPLSRLLSASVGSPEIISAIPASKAEIHNVFGERAAASEATVEYMRRLTRQASSIDACRRVVSEAGTSMASSLTRDATLSAANALLVLAHNDQGTLKLPDGSQLPVAELQASATRPHRPVIVLSCETIDSLVLGPLAVLTNKRLEFDEVNRALRRVQKQLESSQPVTVAEFLPMMSRSLRVETNRRGDRVKMIVVVVGTVLVVSLISVCSGEDKHCFSN